MQKRQQELRIKILQHPCSKGRIANKGESYSFIRKDSAGRPRRYLAGISSGLAVDAHGERMSEDCVKDFLRQSNEKDILLYVNHGKDYTQDIGIMEKSELLENGDWMTSYRLYDEHDEGVPQAKLDEANVAWSQANGLPPYRFKREFGFSIEGLVAEGSVVRTDTGPMLTQVDLDPGVSLVTRPAYQTSVAHAISKALHGRRYGKDLLDDVSRARESERSFYDEKWNIELALDTAIEKITESGLDPEAKTQQLFDTLNSYRDKLVELYDRYGFELEDVEIGVEPQNADEKPPEQKSKRAVSQAPKTGVRFTAKGEPMNAEAVTILSDAVSELQMLLQSFQNGETQQADAEPTQEEQMKNQMQRGQKRKEDETPAKPKAKEPDSDKPEGFEEEPKRAEGDEVLEEFEMGATDEESVEREEEDEKKKKDGEGAATSTSGQPSDAEDMIDDPQPGVDGDDAENVRQKEFKALTARVLATAKSIQNSIRQVNAPKQQSSKVDPNVAKAFKTIAGAVERVATLVEKQNDRLVAVESAFENLLDGLGVGDAIVATQKSQAERQAERPKSVSKGLRAGLGDQSGDAVAQLASAIVEQIGKTENGKTVQKDTTLRSSGPVTKSVLGALFGN